MKQSAVRTPYYWYLAFAIVLVIGLVATINTAIHTSHDLKDSMLDRTDSFAKLIDPTQLTSLKGSDSDIGTPSYDKLKNTFIKVQQVNHDIRFMYVLALNSQNKAFFYLDSEPATSGDYSPPGQLYPEGDADVANIYTQKHSTILPITADRWGRWLSTFSPILDKNGQVIGVLGLDIPANTYYKHIVIDSLVPVLATTLILLVLLWIKHHTKNQQQYLAEKAFFLSFAGHEIRSPLTAVATALKPVEHSPHQTQASKQTLQKVNASLQHILGTIDDVLLIQSTEGLKNQGVHKKPSNIHEILMDTVSSLSLLSEEHDINVIDATDPTNQKLIVNIDPVLFERVISNFLVNSIKYSPKGSNVTVGVSSTIDSWTVQFHNEGPGIPKAEQAKMLKGFYRTKAARQSGQKGTGLGMILAHDIITAHKGKLELESTQNQGVTFRIITPR